MTVIVAVKKDEEIIIGADKRVTEEDTIVSDKSSKILVKDLMIDSYNGVTHEEFLIAFSGLYSLFELLKTFIPPAKKSTQPFTKYLYMFFIPSLNSYLQDYNFIRNYSNGQTGVEWELLIAYKNRLFRVEFNLGVCEITTPYYAIGAPRDIALGSLYTNYNDHPQPLPGYMVATAIRACAAHNILCNDDFELYSIDNQGKIEQFK